MTKTLKLWTIIFAIPGLLYLQISPAYARKGYEGEEAANQEKEKGKSEGQQKLEKDKKDLGEETRNTINTESDENKASESSEDTASIVLTVLFMLVICLAAPMWLLWCPKPDTGLHAVAGVMAIVLEGVFWGMYEKGSKLALQVYESKNKEEYDAQVDAMKTAMELTQKAQTWMTAKFGAQIGIGAIIAIAMAVVLIMSIIQTARSMGAEAAIAQNCATSYNDGPFKSFDATKLYTHQDDFFQGSISKYETLTRMSGCKDVGELAFVNDEIERFGRGEIKSSPISDYAVLQNDKELNAIIGSTKNQFVDFKAFLSNISLMQVARAEDDSSKTSTSTSSGGNNLDAADIASKLAAIGVGLAIGIVVAIVMKVQTVMTWTAWNGWIRAGFYAAEIVFVGVIASFSKKTADQLQKRADAYKNLYEELTKQWANSPGKSPGANAPIPPQQITSNASEQAYQEMNGSCFTDGPGGGASPDPSCGCKASKTCKKTNIPSMKFPDFKTPAVLASSARLASDMGDKMYSGDMRGATVSGAALGRNAVALKNTNDKLMALANSKLAEFGKPPIDFAKNQAQMTNNLKGAMKSAWDSLSPGQRNEMVNAVMGRGSLEKKEEAPTEVAAVSPGTKGGGPSVAPGKKKGIFDFIGGDEEKKGLAGGKGAKEEGEAKGLDAYEDSSKQITEGADKNLFKLIEIRYMKTAYPIFFEANP